MNLSKYNNERSTYMKGKTINIPYQIKMADSFFKRFKGLMFRKEPIKNEGLWIVPCNAVHMFFHELPYRYCSS